MNMDHNYSREENIFRPSSAEEVDSFLLKWQRKNNLNTDGDIDPDIDPTKPYGNGSGSRRPGSCGCRHEDRAQLISKFRDGKTRRRSCGSVDGGGGGEFLFQSDSRLEPPEGAGGRGLHSADALVTALGHKPIPGLNNGNANTHQSLDVERALAGESLLLHVGNPLPFDEDHLNISMTMRNVGSLAQTQPSMSSLSKVLDEADIRAAQRSAEAHLAV
jgi:hypothetical protein